MLEEIVEAGRTKKRQERWLVLGGFLQQEGKRNLSYEEIRELAGYHAEKGSLPPGYTNTRASHL